MGTAESALRFNLFARDMTGPGVKSAESSFSRLGKGIAAGFAAAGVGAGVALAALGKASFSAASNLQQSMGAVDAVFGKSSDRVDKWAEQSAQSLGLATSEYSNLAALLGSQLTNMGRSQDQAAKQSNNLIKLGADLAATYGGSVADAVSAVSSVLKGETDPIERYGVSIKQSDINARLAAQGLDKLEGSAKKQATATAALGLIMEQTTKAQGAFGREANTAAGQQARFSANVENLKASIGAGLLPVMTRTFSFLNERGIPALREFFTNVQSGGGVFARFREGLASVGAFISGTVVPLLQRFGAWFTSEGWPAIRRFATAFWQDLQPAIKQVSATFQQDLRPALEGLIAKFQQAWPTIQRVLTILGQLGEFILTKVVPVLISFYGKYLATAIKVLGELFAAGWKVIGVLLDLGEALGKAGQAVGKFVAQVAAMPGKAVQAVGDLSGKLVSAGEDLVRGMIQGIRNGAGWLYSEIKSALVDKPMHLITHPWEIFSPSRVSRGYGQNISEGMALGVKDAAPKVSAAVSAMVAKAKAQMEAAKEFAKQIRATFASLGDITTIDTQLEDGTSGGLGAMLAGLRKRIEDASAFAAAIKRLRKLGLNEKSLANLRDAGPEGGLQAAQQLLTGGKSAIGEVNQLTKQLAQTAQLFATRETNANFGFANHPAATSAGRQNIELVIKPAPGGDKMTRVLVEMLQEWVRVNGQGNVQKALGKR